jgi:predicted ATPase
MLGFDFYLSSTTRLACEFHLELRVMEAYSVTVAREECQIHTPEGSHYYVVENGTVTGSAPVFPAVSVDRIYLQNASGLPEFRRVFEFLASIGSSEPTPPSRHTMLQGFQGAMRRRTAGAQEAELALRFQNLINNQPDRLQIIEQYLRAIAPPFDRVEVDVENNQLTFHFIERHESGALLRFHLEQSSAGLINSAEILLELFELPGEARPVAPVIVEEPEALLHPGAIQALRDSFVEASRTRQVLVTTHSPELLDDPAILPTWIRVVYRDDAGTHVGTLDPATESIIRDHLYTSGELLRQGGLVSKP